MAGKTKNPKRIMQVYPKMRKHIAEIGEIVWAWNMLHSLLSGIFIVLCGKESSNNRIVKSIWLSVASDSLQRKLIRDVLSSKDKSEFAEEVLWILKKADDLSQYRNSFVHTPFFTDDNNEFNFINMGAKEKYINNLKGIKNSNNFLNIVNDIHNLSGYTANLLKIYLDDESVDVKRRPNLTMCSDSKKERKM